LGNRCFRSEERYELHLEGFQGIELLGLENVVNLFLSKCPNVTDLSALRKVQKLQLLNTSGDFQSLQEYGQLTELSIGRSAGSSSFRINPDMTVFGKQLDKLDLLRASKRISRICTPVGLG
jgi:hypothetical protein